MGGLYKAARIAAMAEVSGNACVAGSNLEQGIGIVASMHFVSITPVVSGACDFFVRSYLHECDLIDLGVPEWIENGHLKVWLGSVSGVNFLDHLAEKYSYTSRHTCRIGRQVCLLVRYATCGAPDVVFVVRLLALLIGVGYLLLQEDLLCGKVLFLTLQFYVV